jgi:hypothetical protein
MFLNKITQPPGTGRTGWGIMANWPNGETNPVNTWIGCETKEASGLLSKMTGYNDGKLRLWTMRRITAQRTVELRRNGVLDNRTVGNTFMNDVDNKATPVTLGGMRSTPTSGAGFNFNGDIAEAVAVSGSLGDADLALLEAYLIAKYAL